MGSATSEAKQEEDPRLLWLGGGGAACIMVSAIMLATGTSAKIMTNWSTHA